MKVLILGPVVNEYVSGGVAVFDEGLCQGFIDNNDDVNIISINKSSKFNNICVGNNNSKALSVFLRFRKIAKHIKNIKPDLVISSLHYSLGIKKYKKSWPNATYIHILHGTPCSINGKIKALIVNFCNRHAKKHFHKLVTVSHLSYAINHKINRVVCDEIINTGCTLSLPAREKFDAERKYDFCYVGRLFKDKNIEMMMDAFIKLHSKNQNLRICIAGFGEQESFFQKGGKYDLSFVDFLGKVGHDEVNEIYLNSKYFISLCSLEACGLAFSEAAINGCNPIASLSSGQTPLFSKYGFYHEVSNLNSEMLYKDLESVLKKYVNVKYSDAKELMETFSYKNIALKYKSLSNKK